MIETIKNYVKNHLALSILYLLIFIGLSAMTIEGTLSYPYIMADRQIQMIRYCVFGSNVFTTKEFGFTVDLPKDYCFLPNRIFPADTSVQVLPKGPYFVLNEYIKGTIVEESRSTLLFEPVIPGRSPEEVLAQLKNGGFLNEAKQSEFTNKNGIKIIVARNVRGVDPTTHYDWAFLVHPNKKVFLSVLLSNPDRSEVFDHILQNIKAI